MIESFKLPNITPEAITGSICSFNDEYGGLPLKSCVSQITGYQEGSGTPSPSNVRNLVSFNSATLTENGNTHLFSFGQSIYQGSIDWKRGVVVATHAFEVYDGSSDENWSLASANPDNRRFIIRLSNQYTNRENSLCNYLTFSSSNAGAWGTYVLASDEYLAIKDNTINFRDLTTFIAYLSSNPLQFAYELATPIEIPLGGINLLTQQGVNNIFCDTGDTTLEWLKVN